MGGLTTSASAGNSFNKLDVDSSNNIALIGYSSDTSVIGTSGGSTQTFATYFQDSSNSFLWTRTYTFTSVNGYMPDYRSITFSPDTLSILLLFQNPMALLLL